MADTLTLDTAVQFVIDRGASVRLIGDDQQLAAIGAGGVLRDIQHTHGAVQPRPSCTASPTPPKRTPPSPSAKATPALEFYLDHGRVHVGDLATSHRRCFAAWAPTERPDSTRSCSPRPATSSPSSTAAPATIASTSHPAASRGAPRRREPGQCRRRDHHPSQRPPTPPHRHRLGQERRPLDHHQVDHQRRPRPSGTPAATSRSGCPPTTSRESTGLGYATTIHAAQGVTADTMHGLLTGHGVPAAALHDAHPRPARQPPLPPAPQVDAQRSSARPSRKWVIPTCATSAASRAGWRRAETWRRPDRRPDGARLDVAQDGGLELSPEMLACRGRPHV